MCALFLPIAHETAGAARIRHSLRPLFGEGEEFLANLGRNALREREAISTSLRATGSRECALDDRLREAIHSAAKRKNGLLRFARNDGVLFDNLALPSSSHVCYGGLRIGTGEGTA